MANETDVKTREKKLKKKIRELEEEKSQFTIDKRKFKQEQNNNSSILTNSLKTVENAAILTQVQTEPNLECMETHSLKATNMDTTVMETTLKLNINTPATTSLPEFTRREANSCELSSQEPAGSNQRTSAKTPSDPQTKLLEDLLKGIEKKTEELSRKMDESNLKCMDIRNTLRNNHPD